MLLAVLNFLVDYNAVEPLFGRLGNQLLRQRNMLFSRKTKTVDDEFEFVFGGFNAFGNLHLLLARQQRHLAHFLEIHADWIVQNVEPHLLVFVFRLGLFDAVHFRLVDDLDLQVAELEVDLVQFLRPDEALGQRVVDVAVGEVALHLGQADQFLYLLCDFETREVGGGSLVGVRRQQSHVDFESGGRPEPT